MIVHRYRLVLVLGVFLMLAWPLQGRQLWTGEQAVCQTQPTGPTLDHVVIAVRDLAAAVTYYRDVLGFSIKPGRVHANGIENAHIRLPDGSALELLTAMDPGDSLAQSYVDFLRRQEGGAYVAVAAGPVDRVVDRIRDVGILPVVTRRPAYDWVAFPVNHPLHALFFIDTRSRSIDEPSHLRHANGALGVARTTVELERGGLGGVVLEAVGARQCAVTDGVAVYGLAVGAVLIRERPTALRGPPIPEIAIRVRDLALVESRLGRRADMEGRVRVAPEEAFGIGLTFVSVGPDHDA